MIAARKNWSAIPEATSRQETLLLAELISQARLTSTHRPNALVIRSKTYLLVLTGNSPLNALGKSSPNVVFIFNSPLPSDRRIGNEPLQNSAKTWRHDPQGVEASSVASAIAWKFLSPSTTAEKIAARSAQIVKPEETFSILQPRNTLLLVVSRAAPTKYSE